MDVEEPCVVVVITAILKREYTSNVRIAQEEVLNATKTTIIEMSMLPVPVVVKAVVVDNPEVVPRCELGMIST